MNIGIVNAGVGSIHSLVNSLGLLGYSSTIVSDYSKLSDLITEDIFLLMTGSDTKEDSE